VTVAVTVAVTVTSQEIIIMIRIVQMNLTRGEGGGIGGVEDIQVGEGVEVEAVVRTLLHRKH
jgi:hypothetical protein